MDEIYSILEIFNSKFLYGSAKPSPMVEKCSEIIRSLISYIDVNPLKLNKS